MQDKPDKDVCIVGCGDIGRRVACLLQVQGLAVTGVVRSQLGLQALQKAGIAALRIDLDSGRDTQWAGRFTHFFYFAPPPRQGKQDTRMGAFLASLDTERPPQRIVYISTSAVYGDCRGAWITENQPASPDTARGQRRLDAENRLREWCESHAVAWIILRVPGIYGPGKLPLERLRQGAPVLCEADAPYTNRIHSEDLAAVCVAAMTSRRNNTIYNVSDGHPSNMSDYFFQVADAAGIPRPPAVSWAEAQQQLSPAMLSFLRDSRRMDNTKLLGELGIELKYPDLAAGLPSCLPQVNDDPEATSR
jgi:nucleoside-diphosphate-sugar epimerase